ncbi:MAG: RimK family alpha-L-glutamate ligase [Blastocatellia bacterium]
MILVCGGLADVVTELVCSRLESLKYDYRLLNLGLFPAGYKVTWDWRGQEPKGVIASPDWSLDLDDVSGVFVRYLGRDGHAPIASIPDELQDLAIAESQAGLAALLEDLPIPIANRSAGALSNNSKPYQALQVLEAGLLPPPTLITSDPQAALEFYEELNGEVIFKSLSGVRSIVRKMVSEDLKRLPFLNHSVTQFQAYLPGDNVRVHTVGSEIFATRIRTEVVDYRYAKRQGGEAVMEATELPAEIADACLRLAGKLNLLIAGIDLKQTPGGAWYCFEINPSPGFAYYEQRTGQPISAALAGLLRGESRPRRLSRAANHSHTAN